MEAPIEAQGRHPEMYPVLKHKEGSSSRYCIRLLTSLYWFLIQLANKSANNPQTRPPTTNHLMKPSTNPATRPPTRPPINPTMRLPTSPPTRASTSPPMASWASFFSHGGALRSTKRCWSLATRTGSKDKTSRSRARLF
jgi:hypothetical protein